MRHRLLGAASAAALLAAPVATSAGPITGYPPATTPLTGSETVIGAQSGATVQVSTGSIAALVTGQANTYGGLQTFEPPGSGHGSIVLAPGAVSGAAPANGSLWTTSSGLFGEIAGVTHQFADLDGNTYTGEEVLAPSAAGSAGLNIGQGVAPTSPVNGDAWATSTALFVRLNGATQQEAVLGLAQTFTAAQSFASGDLKLNGASTGATTLNSGLSGSSNNTLTLPTTASDTLAALGTVQTFSAAQTFNGGLISSMNSKPLPGSFGSRRIFTWP